ncbi:MAG TPA: MFS transporter [Gaiellaceae bacterium]|nr:MFS transporter [Gaiellaceae bacterium]
MDRAPLGRRRALALLALALVLSMTTWFSATAVVPQLREDWGLSDTAAAWLTIAVQLGFVAGALVSSVLNLADVLSARAVLLAGGGGAAAANALLVAVGSASAAIPLRFATGFFLAGVYPPALKLMSTWFQRGRGTALGILVGALTLGSAGPHLVNGLGGLDWRTVIAATSALTLAGGVLAFSVVREGPHPFPRATFDPRQARLVFANRGVRLASLGYFGHMWELYAMWAWFVVFFTEAVGAGGSGPAYATFAVIGIGALGCWAGGVLGDRIGRAETTAAMMAASGACAVLIGLLLDAPTWLVLLVGLVWGFTVVADSAQFSTLVTEHADQAYVGTALTMQLAVGFTLTVATIWLLPFLVDAVGWRWAFAFLAPGPALGVVSMLRLRSAGH